MNTRVESPSSHPHVRICVYAFSSTAYFFRALIDLCNAADDPVDWSVIQPQGHFLPLFDGVLARDRHCYLYDDFNARYAVDNTSWREGALASGEGLVTALLKDKDGYRWLDKQEQLRRGAVMYGVYRDFLERIKPDFVLFPDLEVVDGFILMNLCQELGIGVLYFTGLRLIGAAFFSTSPYEVLPPYYGNFSDDDLHQARVAIEDFNQRRPNGKICNYAPVFTPKPSWYRRLVNSTILRIGREKLHASEETFWMRIARHILHIVNPLRRWRFDIVSARYFDLRRGERNLPDRYIFYALHYTPESSINGLEPYYVDQMRVVDALLLNLPPGYRLVVKEHPAMVGVRPQSFYRELRCKPGLILAHPDMDSRELALRSALVVTVTGTIGLECYLLDKPCILFGRTFFSHLCYGAPPLKDMRRVIETIIRDHKPVSTAEKEAALAKLVSISGNFTIGDPWYVPLVMSPENIGAARDYLWRHIERLRTPAPTTDSSVAR